MPVTIRYLTIKEKVLSENNVLTVWFPAVQRRMASPTHARHFQENKTLEVNLVSSKEKLHIL
jgi:hypothetical protein